MPHEAPPCCDSCERRRELRGRHVALRRAGPPPALGRAVVAEVQMGSPPFGKAPTLREAVGKTRKMVLNFIGHGIHGRPIYRRSAQHILVPAR